MWNYFSPEDLQWYSWELDGARAWLRKNGEEWRLALEGIDFRAIQPGARGPIPAAPSPALPIFFGVGKGTKIALKPQLAHRPYVIAVRNDVRLLPGAEAQFDIALPPLLRFELEGGKVLLEAEPFTVPNTWFGDKTSGNLCHSLPCHSIRAVQVKSRRRLIAPLRALTTLSDISRAAPLCNAGL